MRLTKEAAPKPVKGSEEFLWKTREGKKLCLNQIEDRHLYNICGLLQRRLEWVRKLENDIAASCCEDDFGGSLIFAFNVTSAKCAIKEGLRIVKAELLNRGVTVPKSGENNEKLVPKTWF